ncbi:MAG TPA: response regulator [Terriglobales bacterium]
MTYSILCIDDNLARVTDRQQSLENAGFVVMVARDENQAIEILNSRRVDVVFIDSRLLCAGRTRVGAHIKHLRPQARVVLICERGMVPAIWREHVDVIVDDSELGKKAQWLIEELQNRHFPFFEEWFGNWKRRATESRGRALSSCGTDSAVNGLMTN